MKFLNIAVMLALFVGFASCDSIFDDVSPSTSISADQALGSEEGVDGIRTSMYAKILGSFDLTTEYMIGPSVLADETCNRPGATRFQALCVAEGLTGTAHISPYGGAYELIQDANLLIGALGDGVVSDAKKTQYQGEAYALRAFAYHTLVRAFGYEPGNFSNGPQANFNLGVMLRTVPTLTLEDAQPVARATVNEVYTQILADLDMAQTLLTTENAGSVYYPSVAFVRALRARVLLYQGSYADAATEAAAAITASGLTLANTAEAVDAMFQADPNPESIFEIVVNANTEAIAGGNTNSGLAAYTSDQWVAQVPTNALMDRYDAADYRLAGWFNDCLAQQTTGAAANGCADVNDEGFSITKWSGSEGNLVDDIPMFRLSELYLIQAEAAAKAGTVADGIAPLNTLRTARGLTTVAAGDFANIAAFEDEILDERSRELVVEGHRFWDLKRLGRDVPDLNGAIKMRSNSFRILAPFGTANQNVNPLLVENPSYPTAE